jgi:RsiW-degrading membrane proteinase PrsW (M82 family)
MIYALLFIFVAAAAGLAWYLIAHDRGEKEPVAALWLAAGFGVLGALLAAKLETVLVQTGNLQPGTPEGPLLVAALSVGFIEEACKFFPLALYLYRKRYFNEHTDGVIYFALAGLGFGLPENILYTLQYGAKTGMIRAVLTPIFHAAATGIIGYFLVRRKLAGKMPFTVLLPFAAVAVLHGLYDFGLTSGVPVYAASALAITLGVSGALFVLYLRGTEQDQDTGLSIVGHNSFCRSCGQANPQHHLYCVHCGKNA